MGWVFGQEQGAWSGPLIWLEMLSSSNAVDTPSRFIQIHITYMVITWKTLHEVLSIDIQ